VMHLHFHMLGGAKLDWPYLALEEEAKKSL